MWFMILILILIALYIYITLRHHRIINPTDIINVCWFLGEVSLLSRKENCKDNSKIIFSSQSDEIIESFRSFLKKNKPIIFYMPYRSSLNFFYALKDIWIYFERFVFLFPILIMLLFLLTMYQIPAAELNQGINQIVLFLREYIPGINKNIAPAEWGTLWVIILLICFFNVLYYFRSPANSAFLDSRMADVFLGLLDKAEQRDAFKKNETVLREYFSKELESIKMEASYKNDMLIFFFGLFILASFQFQKITYYFGWYISLIIVFTFISLLLGRYLYKQHIYRVLRVIHTALLHEELAET